MALWQLNRKDGPSYRLIDLPRSRSEMPTNNGGIHDLSFNQSQSLLATGSENPNELAILRTDDWQPMAVCTGHTDWIFGADWVSEDVVFTCSRDKDLRVWKIPQEYRGDEVITLHSTFTLTGHSDKVRAMKYNSNTRLVGSLGADKKVMFRSSECGDLVSCVATKDTEDLICLETDTKYDLFAVGGRDFVSLIDPRCQKIVRDLKSADRHMGVRSVCFHHNLLSMGGGMGRLAFYDLIADAFVHYPSHKQGNVVNKPYLQIGRGFLEDLNNRRMGDGEMQAIYTRKLFAAR